MERFAIDAVRADRAAPNVTTRRRAWWIWVVESTCSKLGCGGQQATSSAAAPRWGAGGGGGSWVTVTGFSASVAPRRRWRQLVLLHRRLISLATISGSHPSGQDHDGDQFHHANHQHWPQHTSKNSEQPMQRLRHDEVAEPAGRDQDTNHRDQASAQIR